MGYYRHFFSSQFDLNATVKCLDNFFSLTIYIFKHKAWVGLSLNHRNILNYFFL